MVDLPLENVRVLDLTTIVYGPLATQILGDFGADVVKIEAPGGDPIRHIGDGPGPDVGPVFLGSNRNKRSIMLDLKRAPARDALWRLIETADIFVHNQRPQKIAALGFGPDAVLTRAPTIIYGGLHGYRASGPYGAQPAYDDVIQGEGGLAGAFLDRDGAPQLVPSIMADKTAAVMAANGLLAAYIRRLRTGRGGYLECSMLEAMASFMLVEHQYDAHMDAEAGAIGYPRAMSPHRRPHPTADGHLCMLAYTDKQWRAFWSLAGEPEMAEDPRFADLGARNRNIDALYERAGAALSGRPTEEWLALLNDADIPCGRVNRLSDLRTDPHLNAIGFFRSFDDPTAGRMTFPDTPHQLDGQSLPVRLGVPTLGADGREILRDAGLDAADIDAALRTEV